MFKCTVLYDASNLPSSLLPSAEDLHDLCRPCVLCALSPLLPSPAALVTIACHQTLSVTPYGRKRGLSK